MVIGVLLINLEIIQKVRWLQQAEGHRPCFRSGKIICPFEDKCCWSGICDVEMIKPLVEVEVIE